MNKKICLVTGANSGIGKELALTLALSGAHVIMVCRNEEKGKKALQEIKSQSGSNAIDLLIADLSSQKDIRLLDKIIKFFFISPKEAAEFPSHLALAPEMEKVTGKYFVKGKPVSASAICYDPIFAKKVWDVSHKLVKLNLS